VTRFRTNREVAIHVPDLEAARAFYGGTLGFELEGESEGLLVFGTGEIRLFVVADEEAVPAVPALEVRDYEEARRFLRETGCEIVEEWEEARALYLRDPFGLLWDVVEREDREGEAAEE